MGRSKSTVARGASFGTLRHCPSISCAKRLEGRGRLSSSGNARCSGVLTCTQDLLQQGVNISNGLEPCLAYSRCSAVAQQWPGPLKSYCCDCLPGPQHNLLLQAAEGPRGYPDGLSEGPAGGTTWRGLSIGSQPSYAGPAAGL